MAATIFLLISDIALREAVVEQLRSAKIGEARIVDNVQSLVKQAEGENACIILIDDNAYDKKTSAVLRVFIEKQKNITLLMFANKDEEAEDVTETFIKPFRLGHLLTRMRYYLETAPLLRDRTIHFGPYSLEPHNRRIICDNGVDPIRLTEKETALLVFLANRTEPATRQEILADVWGYGDGIDTHTLETHIYQLRRKLDKDNYNWLIFDAGAYRLARGKA